MKEILNQIKSRCPTPPRVGVFGSLPIEDRLGLPLVLGWGIPPRPICEECLNLGKLGVLVAISLRYLLAHPLPSEHCVFGTNNCLYCASPRSERTGILRLDRRRCFRHRNCQPYLTRLRSVWQRWTPTFIPTCPICQGLGMRSLSEKECSMMLLDLARELGNPPKLNEASRRMFYLLAHSTTPEAPHVPLLIQMWRDLTT